MKTLVYKYKCVNKGDEDKMRILQLQGSIDFRRCYNNMELMDDKTFKDSLNIKSAKFKEYLKKEVIAFYDRNVTSKERILEKITELEESKEKLTNKEFLKLVRLRKSYKSKVVFGSKKNLKEINNIVNQLRNTNLSEHETEFLNERLVKAKNNYKEDRLYPLHFTGEASTKGNRFFDFSNLDKGEILFKLEKTKIKIPITISTKKHKDELIRLQDLAMNKSIPITVKLKHDKIHITFDESILHGSNFDKKKFYKEAPKDNKEARMAFLKDKHTEHEVFLKQGKMERYLCVDLNPNQIGFVITDKNLKVIDRGCYEIEGKVPSNKRKYEYSQIVKQLFKRIKHYKCSYFIAENLEGIVKEDHGNKVSNRKIKNEWKLNYIKQLIKKRCHETLTIAISDEAYYSSFIGNLNYEYYDPISSALEMCRRGINKYTKGFKKIPDFDVNNIATDKAEWLTRDCDVDLSLVKNYQELFKSIRNKSYRRKEKTFFSYLLSHSSHTCLYL